ncbi:Protein of unknown function [Pyronema omphalodes CBS 100304]|uniref:Uncharacterized protein n=1 Tax=Pyronema omphalodes (strain CBS 100304) TaxID=1076935 RepID=U4KTR1_PYROM|nr:Protein of unknown function [Pyronema omphalodes CBS 100304]
MEGKADKSAAPKHAIGTSAANQSSDAAGQIHQAGGQGEAAPAAEPVPEDGASENYSVARWRAQSKKDDGVRYYQQ